MDINKALEKLREDEHYYGAFGKKFLSNSDIGTLLKDPLSFGQPREMTPAFLVGGYFHTAILEPDKLMKYRIIDASTRNTNVYKELSGGEMCMLEKEKDQADLLVDTIMSNDFAKALIKPINYEYEKPGIHELFGRKWKGKADIINHDDGLIVDLKTTANLDDFRWSAKKYNYDSQAYIYSQMFGYDMIFLAIDKKTKKIGIFDCSPQFLESGKDKVERAVEAYNLFVADENFDPTNYFINETL